MASSEANARFYAAVALARSLLIQNEPDQSVHSTGRSVSFRESHLTMVELSIQRGRLRSKGNR